MTKKKFLNRSLESSLDNVLTPLILKYDIEIRRDEGKEPEVKWGRGRDKKGEEA